MTASTDDIRLRPLSVGEIFDRAITLYVRNLKPFIIAACTVAVPSALMQFFLVSSGASNLSSVLTTSNTSATASMNRLLSLTNPLMILAFLLVLVMTPFMYVAIASLVGRIYRKEESDVLASYGVAFRHVGGIIMTLICAFFIALGAGLAVMIVAFILAALGVVTFGIGFIALFAFIVAAVAFFMMLNLSFSLAFDAIGIDEAPFGRAIGESLSRVFSREEWKKAILISLALFAVQIGVGLVSGGIQGLLELVIRIPLLEAALLGVLTLVSSGFVGVLVAVYYFDVRIRREGLDIMASLDSLEPKTIT